jgi:cell division protein FtsZ
LNSPLLNNNDIRGARNILVNITSGEKQEVTMDEMNLVNEYVQEQAGNSADLIYGVAVDPEMDDQISVTVIATGFKSSSIPELNNGKAEKKEKVSLMDDKNVFSDTFEEPASAANNEAQHPLFAEDPVDKKDEIIKRLYQPIRMETFTEGPSEAAKKVMQVNFFNESEDYIDQLSKIPAYERRKMKDPKNAINKGKEMSRYSLSNNPEEGPKLRKNNSFLHDKAD